MVTSQCRICIYTDKTHRQGDNILLVTRLLRHDGSVFKNFAGYDIRVTISTPRAIFKQVVYKDGSWDGDSSIADLDDSGYIAIHFDSEITKTMMGLYRIQFEVSDDAGTILSSLVPAFEIVPFTISKIQ